MFKDGLVQENRNSIANALNSRLSYTITETKKVFILIKCSSLDALEVVIMTTSSATSDENFVTMTSFSFQLLTHRLTLINYSRT